MMLHKAGKPKDLVGSYRTLNLTSCFIALMITYSNCWELLNMALTNVIPLQVSFLMLRKSSTEFGLIGFFLS